MVIISRQGSLGLLYTWTIIILGGGWLWKVFPQLNFDQIDTLAILIVLGILAEWVAVPFSQGYLSGGFVIVLATQLIGGGVATVWVTGIVSVIGQGIANRGNPLRTTLFNGAQHVLAAAVADIAFSLTTGKVLPIFLYTLVYFGVNHLLVYLYLLPGCRDHPGLFGWDALRWDSYTYLFTAPYGALMARLYLTSGTKWALLFFLPVLAAQILLKKYVQLEVSNRELTALFQVAKGLRGSDQPEMFFDRILQESRRIVDYHTALILFWSRERQLFLPGAAQGAALEEMRNIVLTPGEGLVGQAVQSKESLLVDDVREIPPAVAGPFGKFRSLLIIPLLAQGEVTGVLILGDMHPYAYEEKHMQMLSILGGQAGIVLAHDMLVDKIKYMAVTDRLTNFLHHRQFYQQVVKEMVNVNSEGAVGSLLLVDIDNLRAFNSRYGHAAGDGVIQMVASVLRDVTPPSDILGRYGGGELAVLAMGLSTPEALQLAEKIRIEVRDRRLVPEGARTEVMITVSIGVAVFLQDTTDTDKLFQGAEKAVARAKELGRDRSMAYSQLIKQMKLKITSDKNNVVQ